MGPRVCIVAAHPDDESIGASSVLLHGSDVVVVHVTNGVPRDARWWAPGVIDPDGYRSAREREAERALRSVGAMRIALGFDDQQVVYQLDAVVEALASAFARVRPDVIISHAYEGGHPDHDAVAYAVARARGSIPALEMALYHGEGGALRAGELIGREPYLRYELNATELQHRRELLGAYASQRTVLAPFLEIATESFRPACTYDFSQPPHAGALHYERIGMKPAPVVWRALVGEMRVS
jgi:LmbE family N-acetylglucosaminyl deacetylase